ncbi:antitoxin [Micromonospora yasonensis]|uniref:antitoxin n=1 Tax=Micromonospora yasonensis TaxID=1128667 RepID=UPI00222FB2BA|nr:antitoxin [Micromonospora yasonensis]MCW3841205.1 antitoxin [Micromonospora yasonensis]
MRDFADKAEDLAKQHPKQADEGVQKAGQQVDQRTGERYDKQVQQGEQAAEKRINQGNPNR